MLTPGRKFSAGSGYRYGYNGQENDKDISTGDQDYKMRIYDTRLGRFLSVDPLVKEYPKQTPYSYASNAPIHAKDIEGLESSHDFDIGDPSVHLMYEWAKEEGSGGTLLNNKYYNKFDKARTTTIAMGLGVLTSYYLAPAATIELGFVGASVEGTISGIKSNGDPYEIAKGAFSGFFSGAVLAAGPSNISSLASFFQVASVGALSGMLGSTADQTFDNMFGKGGGYDVKNILISGGVGALANVFATGLIQTINQQIDKAVLNQVAETKTASYRKLIKNAIKEETPGIGTQALKKVTNSRIQQAQALLKKQGEKVKAAVQQAIDKSSDALQDKIKDGTK